MAAFGAGLGHGDASASYSALLAADAAGALTGGIVLEAHGLQPNARTAFAFAMLWCCAIAGFALSSSYPLALALLFTPGFLELSFNSMAQSLVQLHAPPPIRGRVIGLYSMAGPWLRALLALALRGMRSPTRLQMSNSIKRLLLLR